MMNVHHEVELWYTTLSTVTDMAVMMMISECASGPMRCWAVR